MKRLEKIRQLPAKLLPDTALFGKIQRTLLWLLVGYTACIYLAQSGAIFNIPINKPYFTGKWDEPFAINSGVNVLMEKGDPMFYNYGGPSVYPFAFTFYHHARQHKVCPVYKDMDKEYGNTAWPICRKTTPVKPIYLSKAVALLIYLAGSAAFTIMFVLLMFPASFLTMPATGNSLVFREYSELMLPETQLNIMAGIASLAFIRAVLEEDMDRYYRWTVFCFAAASMTVANKINAIFIMLLPISLLWRLLREKKLTWKRSGMIGAAMTAPYILMNPAIIFNTRNYYLWAKSMMNVNMEQPDPNVLGRNSNAIHQFFQNVHIFQIFSVVVLIALFIAACVIISRKNPAALTGILFFLAISFYFTTMMKHKLVVTQPRHYMFIALPLHVFFLSPLAYWYKISGKGLKTVITLICLLAMFNVYSPVQVFSDISRLPGRTFTHQWPRESRDDLIDFVKSQNAVIYFYDFHGFSMPDNIRGQLISFSTREELPEQLAPNEYIGFILYKQADKIEQNSNGQYNEMTEFLTNRYQTVKILGTPGGAHNMHEDTPQANPSIIILK